uniref:VQ domain-containing protein n=1 Tax=Oryza punctata TaxID=4537 RepID=A0A0E0LV12_ORYPU
MDSGNSGSLQSSSGGDDEFDSRCGGGGGGADSSPLSALLRQSAAASGFGGGSFYGLQELASPPPPPHLPPLSQAAAHHWTAALPGGGGAAAGAGASSSPSSSTPHGVQVSAEQAAQQGVAPPMKGSRKRTRASRRAPTTVLTTDTSNFRAMVQEFTGIPSPPFAGPPARSRFDHLFPAPSSLRSVAAAAGGGSPSSLPAYLLRPFAQKLHPSPFPPFPSPSTSSPSPSNIAIANSTAAASTAAVAAPGDRYHLASAPSSSLLGMQDHGGSYLSFQSHLGGAQLGAGDVKYTAHPMFDAPGSDLAPPPPSQRLQDPAGFLGLTHGIMSAEGTHMHQQQRSRDHAHGGDELSGVVGAASMMTGSGGGGGGCKKTIYSSGAGAAHAAPQLERNAESTSVTVAAAPTHSSAAATTAMRTQSVDSWICTSE